MTDVKYICNSLILISKKIMFFELYLFKHYSALGKSEAKEIAKYNNHNTPISKT